MKVLPVQTSSRFIKPVFKGYIVSDYYSYGEPRTHIATANNTDRRKEMTLDNYHTDRTNRIYYADPLEKVSDHIKEIVDYVVYDDEPKFPDVNEEISKLYFYPPEMFAESNYAQKIDNFRQYFYRLEMADSKSIGNYEHDLWNNINPQQSREKIDYFMSHVNDAKYNQETAATFMNIMNESLGLRHHKDNLYCTMLSIENRINKCQLEIPKANKELEQRKSLDEIIAARIKNLKSKEELYTKLNKTLEKSSKELPVDINTTGQALEYNTRNHTEEVDNSLNNQFLAKPASTRTYKQINSRLSNDYDNEQNEKKRILSMLENIRASLKQYEAESEKNKIYIAKITEYIKALSEIINNLQTKYSETSSQYERAKAELIPHFDKLKNYFYSRGIKSIK